MYQFQYDSSVRHTVRTMIEAHRWNKVQKRNESISTIHAIFVLMLIIIHQDKNAKYDQSKLMAKCQYNVWGSEWIAEFYYNDVIMSSIASQTTSLTIVYSTVYSGADQIKYQSSAYLACVRVIHRWPVNSRKMPVTRFLSIWWRHHVRITQLLGKAREGKRKRERGRGEERGFWESKHDIKISRFQRSRSFERRFYPIS